MICRATLTRVRKDFMKYLDLINKCLVELNYKKVKTFDELVKNDHLKIKNILNIVNSEVCTFDDWNFLLKQTSLILPANTGEIKNTVDGRIKTLSIDNSIYEFTNDFESFLFSSKKDKRYSVLGEMLFLPVFETEKEIKVIYSTNDFAKTSENVAKREMTLADDESVIPDTFVEPLLVYGTCMRMKANLEYPKFNYWLAMYNKALANMRSKLAVSADETPSIVIRRSV